MAEKQPNGKQAHRAIRKRWNHALFEPKPATPQQRPASWWTVACQPGEHERFSEVAKERNRHQWSNIGPIKVNPKAGFV